MKNNNCPEIYQLYNQNQFENSNTYNATYIPQ